MKKKVLIFLCFFVLVGLIVINILLLRPKDYTVTYQVGDAKIEEKYDAELGYYAFTVDIGDNKFYDAIISNNVGGKKVITEAKLVEDEKEACVILESKKLEMYPLCIKDDKYVDISLVEMDTNDFFDRDTVKDELQKYDDLKITARKDRNFLVWGQKGYYYIGSNGIEEVMFLDSQSYYNNLAYKIGGLVITPDYDEEYNFDTFFIINLKNGKLSKWETDYTINYNSYYLGSKDGNIYLFDRKDKVEYSINPAKKKIDIVSKDGNSKVWNTEWEMVSSTKLASSDYEFKFERAFDYFIENKVLYKKIRDVDEKIEISKKPVDVILEMNGDEVFYLAGDTLYSYTPRYGEVELATYSEWNFNNKNTVFINN